MKLKKGLKRLIIIVLVILLLGLLGFGGYKVYKKLSGGDVSEAKVLKEIPDYGYSLKDSATNHYKKLFEELNDTLSNEEVNYDNYAKLVAQMVVADFYTINNKLSKTDVGGAQFILKAYKDNFVLEAEETVYKYVEHNIYGNRTQVLPEVTATEISEIRTSTYTYDTYTDENCYVVTVNLTYKEDLGYPTQVVVKMLHQNNKLEVFYMQ